MARWLGSKKTDFYYEVGDGVNIKPGKASFSWGIIDHEYTQKGKTIYIVSPNPFDYSEDIPDPVHLTKDDFTLDSSETIKEN